MSNNNPESPQKKLSHSLMTTVNTMENKSTVGTSFQYCIDPLIFGQNRVKI